MRVIGLVSFYDEHPAMLRDCLVGLSRAGVDHVVCLDGAYALFPDAQAASPVEQHAALMLTARETGVGLTLHTPRSHWVENEVEKRGFHFRLANALAEPGDWFWIMDADQVVMSAPGLKQRLADTTLDVAATLLHDTVIERIPVGQRAPGMEEDFLLRNVFRAQPINVVKNHYTFVTQDGRVLWGGQGDEQEPCLDLGDVVVNHYPDRRERERIHRKHVYYTDRDLKGVELGECMRCDPPAAKAVRKVATGLRLVNRDGRPFAAGSWIECCEKHARRAEYENRWRLIELGFDPDRGHFDRATGEFVPSGRFENRNGNLAALVA